MTTTYISIACLIFAYGLIIGSFLNVVIYRLPRGENLAYPSSHCPKCNTRLRALDLVPVFSFLAMRGKCRYCSAPISWIYPAIETLNALLYLGVYVAMGLTTKSVLYMLVSSVLICIAMIDKAHMRIPNSLNLVIAIIALIAITQGIVSWQDALVGSLVGGGILLALNGVAKLLKKSAFGMGDVKYMLAIGALVGLGSALNILLYGSLIAGATILFNLITKRWDATTSFAFGPFLAIGTYIALLQ